jgi:hypothetical protein
VEKKGIRMKEKKGGEKKRKREIGPSVVQHKATPTSEGWMGSVEKKKGPL